MIDFVKLKLSDIYWSKLKDNALLEDKWEYTYTPETGELKRAEAKYKTIHFIYHKPKYSKISTDREITIKFSFSCFLNNGFNHIDPNLSEIKSVRSTLQKEFGIKPEDAKVISIEIGCSINPPTRYSIIQSSIIAYNGKPFNHMTDIGLECYKTEVGVKFYGKHLKYPALQLQPTLRYEIKVIRIRYLNLRFQLTLANVTDKTVLCRFKKYLILNLKNVIYKEEIDLTQLSRSDKKLIEDWSNPLNIQNLKKNYPEEYSSQKSRYKKLMPENGVWSQIQKLISQKWDELTESSSVKQTVISAITSRVKKFENVTNFHVTLDDLINS